MTKLWFGPPLNNEGHWLHGSIPVVRNGRHIGWIRDNGNWWAL